MRLYAVLCIKFCIFIEKCFLCENIYGLDDVFETQIYKDARLFWELGFETQRNKGGQVIFLSKKTQPPDYLMDNQAVVWHENEWEHPLQCSVFLSF